MKRFSEQTERDECKLSDVNRMPKSQSLKDIRGLSKQKEPEISGEWS